MLPAASAAGRVGRVLESDVQQALSHSRRVLAAGAEAMLSSAREQALVLCEVGVQELLQYLQQHPQEQVRLMRPCPPPPRTGEAGPRLLVPPRGSVLPSVA